VETPSADPAERTRWNARDADATLILIDKSGIAVSNGTRLAHVVADEFAKPQIVIDVSAPDSVERTIDWLSAARPNKLGIGGPRESEAPGINVKARAFLVAVLGEVSASRL